MVVISEKIFTADMESKVDVGEIHQVYGLRPIPGTGCCVYRFPIRLSIKSNSNLPDEKMVGVFSMLPIMQAGVIENNSICPRPPLMLPATGSCCDCGRYVTFKRMTFEQMLNTTEAATGGAPATEVTDNAVTLNLSPLSHKFKSDEEIAALPTRPWFFGGEIVIDDTNVMHRE